MGLLQRNGDDHHCMWCEHYGGPIAGGSHAECVREKYPAVQAQPETGCVFWVRAIGSDDESGPARAQPKPWR